MSPTLSVTFPLKLSLGDWLVKEFSGDPDSEVIKIILSREDKEIQIYGWPGF